jgi:peptidoglycan/xylan/chitin deacetylase (PgdA/CDA1 family)
MKRTVVSLCLPLLLACATPAMAADVPIVNAGGENPANLGNEADGWGQNAWGTHTVQFTRPSTGAHSGTYSLRVEMSGYTNGDAKWTHPAVAVTGGKFYTFRDWYKSSVDTAVSMYWQTAEQVRAEAAGQCERAGFESVSCGTWSNLETGIEPSPTQYAQFVAGVDMPTGAVRAYFAHFIARAGYLQTDDYSLEQLDSPPGFKRPLVTLTFDDSTPNLYEYVIPQLDLVGYKSTQYVVTGATGARDDNGTLYQWSAAQINHAHQLGHEIGSHSEYHPNLAMPGPTTVCKGADAAALPVYTAAVGNTCPAGQELKTVPGSWLDPFGGSTLWLKPATIGSPAQDLAATTLTQELGDSKRKLEGNIGYGVPTIAYPYGSYDSTVIAEEKALGYKAARSVDEGYNSKVGLNPFKIRVQNVQQAVCRDSATGAVTKAGGTGDAPTCAANQTITPDVTTAQFKQWIQKAKANNYWLVLVYHPVDDLGVNPYGTSKKRFAEQLQAIKDAGLEVATMRDALNEVMPQIGNWTKLPSPSVTVKPPVDTPPPGPVPGPNPNPPTDHVVVPRPATPAIPSQPQAPAKDATRPTIKVSAPTSRPYRRGRTVRAKFTCSDNVKVVRCKGTVRSGARINTRTRGRKTFKVVATDAAGNARSVTLTYRVR